MSARLANHNLLKKNKNYIIFSGIKINWSSIHWSGEFLHSNLSWWHVFMERYYNSPYKDNLRGSSFLYRMGLNGGASRVHLGEPCLSLSTGSYGNGGTLKIFKVPGSLWTLSCFTYRQITTLSADFGLWSLYICLLACFLFCFLWESKSLILSLCIMEYVFWFQKLKICK